MMPTPSASRPTPLWRCLSAVAGLVLVWAPAGFLTLIALVLSGLRCDESCDPSGPSWKDHAGAWQWTAQLWGLAVPALVAATATVLFLAAGRPRHAGIAGAIAVALAVVWMVFMGLGDA